MKSEYAKNLIYNLLIEIGEEPDRPGIKDTPRRVFEMYKEIFRGYDPKQRPNACVFANGTDGLIYDQMIMDTGTFYSYCEHHMVPFFGTYWFGYIPDPAGNIIGLSKVARLVDYHAAKLQIQERLVNDIVEDLWQALALDGPQPTGFKATNIFPLGMGLIMKAEHLCKTMRGVKKRGEMTTIKLKGKFLTDPSVKEEFINWCTK